jgi:hypothetical protein
MLDVHGISEIDSAFIIRSLSTPSSSLSHLPPPPPFFYILMYLISGLKAVVGIMC